MWDRGTVGQSNRPQNDREITPVILYEYLIRMNPVKRTRDTRVHVEIVFRICRNVDSVNLTASLPPFEPPF